MGRKPGHFKDDVKTCDNCDHCREWDCTNIVCTLWDIDFEYGEEKHSVCDDHKN